MDLGPFSLWVFNSTKDFLLTLQFFLIGVRAERRYIFCLKRQYFCRKGKTSTKMGQFSPVGRLGMPEAQKYKLEGGACPTQHTVLSCLKRKSCSNSSKAWGKNIANCNPPEIIFLSCKAVPLQETTKPWAHTKLEHAERRNKIWEPVWKAPGQNGLQRFVLLEDGTRFHLVALNHLLSPTCALSCCQPSKAFWRLDNLVQPTPNLSDWAFFF